MSVSAADESFTLIVTGSTDYSVEVSDDWLTLDSDIRGTLSFTVSSNTSSHSRTGTITIVVDDVSEEVIVTQAGLSLSIAPTSVSVSGGGKSFTLTVTCDIDYSVEVSDDWLTFDSDDAGTLSFTASANSSDESRTATVTITAGICYTTVDVTQAWAYDASGEINGFDYVDLGLSVKWAAFNIGARSPTERGDYLAWGEIDPKDEYTSSNSVTYGVKMNDFSGNSQYDAAAAIWGSSWRVPTYAECLELINDCTWSLTTKDDVSGYLVTGSSGYSIFLPYAGRYISDSIIYSKTFGCYTCSTPYSATNLDRCYYLYFSSSKQNMASTYRYWGRPVRPVSE